MKFFATFLCLGLIFNAQATTWVFKTEYAQNNTDNVNSSATTKVKDTYSDLIFNLQAKGQEWKWRLKYKMEKYKETTTNNSNYVSTGIVNKPNKNREYTFDVYRLKYTTTPTVVTDVTSDNQGFKLGATFSKDFTKDENGYFSMLFNQKKYTNIANRTDSILDATFGYENNVNNSFVVTPELNLEYNNSKDSYYSNFNIGPSLSLLFNASEAFELFANASLTHTIYSQRTFQQTTHNRTTNVKEHQSLTVMEAGATYTLFGKLPITAKYTSNRNSSNNSASAYQSKVFGISLGLKI
jgi:hypothetical protein